MEQVRSVATLRSLAQRFEMSDAMLDRVCKVATGYATDHMTVIEAQMVAGMLVAKGDVKSREWARELER
jgi:hypothetical protein